METIQVSLFGKECEVIDKHNSDNKFDGDVRCNHCGNVVKYGDTYLLHGIMCCDKCREALYNEIENDKKLNYEIYRKKDYEPFGV